MTNTRTRSKAASWRVLAICLASAANAQAQITLDGTLGHPGPLTGPAFVIPAAVGQQSGGNLFHSFGLFNVNTGESAAFTGPASVANILARVTGGQASSIDGGLRSEIAGANLYFINPAGVRFGPNASLDVSGSFHVATADYLRLGNDGRFDARSPANSVLTAAPPSAFGFIAAAPAPIAFSGSQLRIPAGRTLSVTGGDVQGTNVALRAPGGRVDVVSLASPGEVRPADSPADVTVVGASSMGSVSLGDSELTARGDGGGTVVIRAGRFVLDRSTASTSASGPTNGSILPAAGAGIDIVADAVVLTGSGTELNSNLSAGVAMSTPPIRIRTGSLEIAHGATVNSVAFTGSRGNTGGIQIQANEVNIHDNGIVRSTTSGAGNSGGIGVIADRLTVRDGGLMFTLVFGGASGNAGSLDIVAREITLAHALQSGFALIATQALDGTGLPGNIRITAESIAIGPSTEISSASFGPQRAGDITVVTRNLSITAGSVAGSAGIFANARGQGNAGNITIDGESIRIADRGSIESFANSSGRGGTINLHSDAVVMANGGYIDSSTGGSAQAGDVNISAAALRLSGHSYVSVSSAGTGAAGRIGIATDAMELSDGSRVTALSTGLGAAGTIDIDTRLLTITGAAGAAAPFARDFTGLTTTNFPGPGGSIRVRASEGVLMTNRAATIFADTGGAGHAGTIDLRTPRLELRDGGAIVSNVYGSGNGGTIRIAADDILLSGVDVHLVQDTMGPAGIASQTLSSGAAGAIVIDAGRLRVADGAKISGLTVGSGAGATIDIRAGELTVEGTNATHRDFLLAQGRDPEVAERSASAQITAGSLQVGTQVGSGPGGTITIRADRLIVAELGEIESSTVGVGGGGLIDIAANEIRLDAGGRIAARSTGTGPAGNIRIDAGERFTSVGGGVTTGSSQAGGGSIVLSALDRVYLENSSILTSVQGGGGDAGNISIDPRFVVLNRSQIVANAFAGAGGNITVVADNFIASPGSRVDASSQLGISGTVDIRAPEANVGAGLEGLKTEFFDVSALAGRQCGVGDQTRMSSFVVAGRGGVPPGPDAPLSGSYADLLQ